MENNSNITFAGVRYMEDAPVNHRVRWMWIEFFFFFPLCLLTQGIELVYLPKLGGNEDNWVQCVFVIALSICISQNLISPSMFLDQHLC